MVCSAHLPSPYVLSPLTCLSQKLCFWNHMLANFLPDFFICIPYLQVNYSFYYWKKLKADKPWKFSTVRVLVVDEGSLVSVGIFKSVLKLLCEHAKLSKLIILGKLKHRESLHIQSVLCCGCHSRLQPVGGGKYFSQPIPQLWVGKAACCPSQPGQVFCPVSQPARMSEYSCDKLLLIAWVIAVKIVKMSESD